LLGHSSFECCGKRPAEAGRSNLEAVAPAAVHEFSAYGPSHLVIFVVFAVGAVVLVVLGRRHGTTPVARRAGRLVAVAMLGVQIGVVVHSSMPSRFGIDHSIPLHLSDLVALVAVYALWAYRQWASALTYYWGLTLSTQAFVSPALRGPDFPGLEFLLFWSLHLFVVWTACYLTWGIGMRPGWREYRITLALTACWAAVAMVFNAITGANYGFLNSKPEIGSVLDALGPWPWYLISEAVLVLAIWALMTWPWVRSAPDLR
jgi:hypothetical integral membrane protein (TIGR02206 family)